MGIINIDFESYYDREYSLRRMTPVEYVLDARFDCFGAAVKTAANKPATWLDERDLVPYFASLKQRQKAGEKITLVSHNALFDMCIVVWRYGFLPDLMIDTMGMARAKVIAFTGRVSLEMLARHFNLPAKGDTIKNVSGMDRADMEREGLWEKYKAYACNDADLGWAIFDILRVGYPLEEFMVQDTILRCAVLPRFRLDVELLQDHLSDVLQAKEELLQRIGIEDRSALMSNDKFAEMLRERGVEPEMKISLTTEKETYAFAKTDQFMADLEEHEDENVQALVAARLGHKTTLEETRTERFISIANLRWPSHIGSERRMPIPLRYSGAHTHRLSGDWKLNLQNLRRGGKLRRALTAPPGYTVVTGDESQIEARLVVWRAGCESMLKVFREGGDPYSTFGTEVVYKRPISKKTPKERFVCKQAVLGLGFGMGAPRYDVQIRKDSRLQLKEEIILAPGEALYIVKSYRGTYHEVPAAWKFLNGMIPQIADPGFGELEWGPVLFKHEEVVGPNGLSLYYNNLRQEPGGKYGMQWVFDYAKKPKKLFGGAFYENIIQFLARIIIMDAALRMRKLWPKYPLALQVHDELVYLVRNEDVEEFKISFEQELTRPLWWCPDLPLACEIGTGPNYGDAK